MDMLGTSPCVSAVSRAAPATATSEDETDLRRGPWTVEEDVLLMDYITLHGEGRWNSLARRAGLKRTGKSCRLRWLNYLRPDVRRGNITLEEQLLILELHFRWGNRWSKIARHLPGRTDNEIKNYWRTRVQKHARQLKCDVNSERFRDVMRHLWMPHLVERIQADYGVAAATAAANSNTTAVITTAGSPCAPPQGVYQSASNYVYTCNPPSQVTMTGPDTSSMVGSSSEASLREKLQSIPAMTEGVAAWSRVQCGSTSAMNSDMIHSDMFGESWSELLASAGDDGSTGLPGFGLAEFRDSLWNSDDVNLLQQRC